MPVIQEVFTEKLRITQTPVTMKESGEENSKHRDVPKTWSDVSKHSLFTELSRLGYYVKKRIGEGSYSKVYFGEHVQITRLLEKKKMLSTVPVACKIIDKRNTSDDFYEKFLPRELEVLKTIDHPNIVGIHSIFQMGPFVCICMDYCSQGDLLERIRSKGALSDHRAKLFFFQICSAICYLHNRDISHRDIKCENILIQNKFCVKLTDFGFARRTNELDPIQLCQTYCGSTAYAAPEVLKGIPYDPKLYDMWSLGCVLYVMVFGSMPFDDENIPLTVKKQESHKIDFPEKKLVNFKVKNLISHLLHPDVKKRFRIEDTLDHPWLCTKQVNSLIQFNKRFNFSVFHCANKLTQRSSLDLSQFGFELPNGFTS